MPVRRVAGFSVHVFTASGGAVALLALDAAIERKFPICFAWLGLALFIDGIDGTLARFAKVSETAATIDGAILDLVVDFLTYVLVPVVALWRSDLMPQPIAFWIGLGVVIASALYFADTRMKTNDYWFRGFPAIWNVVAF
jgi:phosphatidylcholine synthase